MSSTIFLSYRNDEEAFVAKVEHALRRQANVDSYFHPLRRRAGDFESQLSDAIAKANAFVLFISTGTHSSKYQHDETKHWIASRKEQDKDPASNCVIVRIDDAGIPFQIADLFGAAEINVQVLEGLEVPRPELTPFASSDCALGILQLLNIETIAFDDLPTTLHVKYEKDVIAEFMEGHGQAPADKVRQGYPERWPAITQLDQGPSNLIPNPLNQDYFGPHRSDKRRVRAMLD